MLGETVCYILLQVCILQAIVFCISAKKELVELKLREYVGVSCLERHPNMELITLSGVDNTEVRTIFLFTAILLVLS